LQEPSQYRHVDLRVQNTAPRQRLAESAKKDAARPTTGISLANYHRIQTGMTYAEVATILGEPGEELSRTELAGSAQLCISGSASVART
jgi:hypothetical protein